METRQEMEVHICCRQTLRTTDSTAQQDTLLYSCGALLIADDHHLSDFLGRKASPVGERDKYPL